MAKIMVIHHAGAIGGGSISFVDVLDMLSENHEIIACCPTTSQDLVEYIKERGHDICPLNIPIPTFNHYSGGQSIFSRTFWKGIFNLKYRKELENYISFFEPDIVMVNSSVMIFLGPIIKKCGSKAICYVRETFVESSIVRTRFIKYMMNKWFDGVIFLSNYDQNYINLKNPLNIVIEDCVDIKKIKYITKNKACDKLKISVNKFNILFVGGLSWIKGLDIALKAISQLDNSTELIVAGDVNFEENNKSKYKHLMRIILSYKEFIHKLRVKKIMNDIEVRNKVKFIGVRRDIEDCYLASDLVIFPSKIAHQARPVYEAALFKKPIIISNFKQTREFVIDNYNGLTFKKNNANDLADKINKLILDSKKRDFLVESNYDMTIKNHNLEKQKEKMIDYIINIINDR